MKDFTDDANLDVGPQEALNPKKNRREKDPFPNATAEGMRALQSHMMMSFIHGVNADANAQNGDIEQSRRDREAFRQSTRQAQAAMAKMAGKKTKRRKLKPFEKL